MHDSALELGRHFFKTYLSDQPEASILDVGSLNVNGTLRPCVPAGLDLAYTGVDLVPGDGVDIVLSDPYKLPFGDSTFDAVVSTSCFANNSMFWLTFIEIVRVTKPSGVIYINAPSNGGYRGYPTDSWRFYPDAGLSLESWSRRQGFDLILLESFAARRRIITSQNDCVMVFERGPASQRSGQRMCLAFPDAMNVRRSDQPGHVLNPFEATEDQQYLSQLLQLYGQRETRIKWLEQELERARAAVGPVVSA